MSDGIDALSQISKQVNDCYIDKEPCDLISKIQQLQATHTGYEQAMKAKITAIQDEYHPVMEEVTDDIKEQFTMLREWVTENQGKLPANSGKSIKFNVGKVLWRKGQNSIVISDEQGLIENLKKLNLTQFLRVKTTVDKSSLVKLDDKLLAELNVTKCRNHDIFQCEPHQGKKLSDTMFKEKADGKNP